MRILPVLDLRQGQVMCGVGGRRHEYRPIVSRLTSSSRPLDVARAFRDHLGLTELYLADLDAIAGASPSVPVYADLQTDGFRLWVDAGLRVPRDAVSLADAHVSGIVAGLETLAGPDVLGELCNLHGERIILSLDLKGGRPLGDLSAWQASAAESIAAQAVVRGVRRLIVLDLAQVGTSGGTATEDLCTRLARTYPAVELTAGGGVRGIADLYRLRQCGVGGVLVSSALHDGRLGREELAACGCTSKHTE